MHIYRTVTGRAAQHARLTQTTEQVAWLLAMPWRSVEAVGHCANHYRWAWKDMTQENQWDKEAVAAVVARLKNQPGALLPVLHGVQDAIGYIPEDAVSLIARELNLSRAEVHGVITFYHHFRQTPAGQHTIQICRAEACQAMHCDATIAHAKDRLNIDFHETDATGKFTLEPVYCLGNCALSPAIMIDDKVHGRVTPEKFEQLLKSLEGAQA